MKRYNDIFDFYISRNHLEVINMLNTKYIIDQGEDGKPIAYNNPDANGNAWFVEEIKPVSSANEEILALDSLNTKTIAITSFQRTFDLKRPVDSLSSINLVDYKPNYLKYQSNNSNHGFVVFSEIYYSDGWQAFIDGVEAEHIRVNYVLRGMEIPSGNHTIEFKFDPEVIKTGSSIALGSTILLGILLLGSLFYEIKNKQK